MWNRNHILVADQLRTGEIYDIRGNFARIDGRLHRVRVHKLAAREIEDLYAVLHLRHRRSVDEARRILSCRNMQRNIITGLENFVITGRDAHRTGQIQRIGHRKIRVIADYLHAERFRNVGYKAADRPKTDHAERFACDFTTGKLSLARLDLLGDIRFVRNSRSPVDPPDNIPRGQKQGADRKLFYRVCVGARRVEYDDARLCAPVNGNIVDARAAACDCQQFFIQRHIMKLCRTHHDRIRVFAGIRYRIGTAKDVCADLCDLVHQFDIHAVTSYFGFFFAKSSMNSTSFSTPSIGIAL